MKKRYFFLLVTLTCASFLCLFHAFLEWFLFLAMFAIALLFLQVGGERKRKGTVSLLDALQEGVIILDWEGRIREINQKGCLLLKQSKKRLLGASLFELSEWSEHHLLFKRVRETRTVQTASLGETTLEMKVLEPKRRLLVTLLDSFAEYEKEQLGKDFVANASHELRTPITIIKGFAETIRDLPEISEAMLDEFTEKIVRNCHRVDGLVKNLLTLADLDYLPKARLQDVDLVGMIDNCSHALLALHPKAEIESFQNEEVILVRGDPDLLELAIMNLLENAVKYSEKSPFLTVTVADFEDRVELSIADRGVGMQKEDLDKIFERFYTVDKAHSRSLGGAGLGLSIVKAILNKHEADIKVVSSLYKGTTFTLTFQKTLAFQG